MARKRKSKPTTSRRSQKQHLKDRYAHAREDAQLAGLIPTVPEEALKSERVDPSRQGIQETLGIDRKAIRNGWQVPEEKKIEVIDRLVDKVLDDGASAAEKAMCANAVLKADQMQWERDHPEESGKAKGGVNINNENKVQVIDWNALPPATLSDPCEEKIREGERLLREREVSAPSGEGFTDASKQEMVDSSSD